MNNFFIAVQVYWMNLLQMVTVFNLQPLKQPVRCIPGVNIFTAEKPAPQQFNLN
jgi:hypothetical protein